MPAGDTSLALARGQIAKVRAVSRPQLAATASGRG